MKGGFLLHTDILCAIYYKPQYAKIWMSYQSTLTMVEYLKSDTFSKVSMTKIYQVKNHSNVAFSVMKQNITNMQNL